MARASHAGLLGDRYRLQEPIGYGGMAQIYRARDEVLDREVAVKLLDEAAFDQQDVTLACIGEARAAARLTHPGIVHVFDAGTHDGTSYVVMELVPGRSLKELVRERGMLPASEAVDIAAQVADALDASHAQGVVHCDLKPQNILVTPSGQAKLVDFGIARGLTVTGPLAVDEIRGSAAYVAPEQVRGERVDGRSDIYALGAVLYTMLTGRPPFQGQSAEAVVAQQLVSDPPRPRTLNPRIAPELEAIVMRALEREPTRRFAHAAEMRDALRAVGASASTRPETTAVADGASTKLAAGAVAAGASARQTTQTQRMPTADGRAWRAHRLPSNPPRPNALLAIAIVALLVLAGLGLAMTGARLGPAPGPAQHEVVAPTLVGHRVSELPKLLEQAGLAPGDVNVSTRPVEQGSVGSVVDQQPQPGKPLDANASMDIAVGVPRR